MRRLLIMAAMCLVALPVAAQQDLPPEVIRYADMILYNGKVLTMDKETADFTVGQAIALRGKEIMAVGDTARIMRMAGPNTQKVDLQGKTVAPGFIDTHVHPEGSGKSHFQSEYRDKLEAMDLYRRVSISMLEWNDRAAAL